MISTCIAFSYYKSGKSLQDAYFKGKEQSSKRNGYGATFCIKGEKKIMYISTCMNSLWEDTQKTNKNGYLWMLEVGLCAGQVEEIHGVYFLTR